jgi:hypothetical protein
MQTWTLHAQVLRNPPTDCMRAVHMLYQTQSVPMLDENSALRGNMPQRNDEGNMPQRNDEEGCKKPRLSFSPAASVWGEDGPRMDDRRPQCASHYGVNHGQGLCCFLPSVPRVTNTYFLFLQEQIKGIIIINPALAPFANVPCRCTRYFMGGDGAWDHVNSCLQHASN